MHEIEYTSSVTSASSLLGDSTLLPGNASRPMELSCDEYVVYVDELLRSIAQQVYRWLSKALSHFVINVFSFMSFFLFMKHFDAIIFNHDGWSLTMRGKVKCRLNIFQCMIDINVFYRAMVVRRGRYCHAKSYIPMSVCDVKGIVM